MFTARARRFNSYSYVSTAIGYMQLRAYLIRNRAPHVINSHVHQAVAFLSGKKNKVMRQSYV